MTRPLTASSVCWPVGRAERRYAGVTHVDVTALAPANLAEIRDLLADNEVSISGLRSTTPTPSHPTVRRPAPPSNTSGA